jgi:DNA-directed RNA polymerase specialized sigma subunit
MSYNETIDNYLYDEENEYTQANDLWEDFFMEKHDEIDERPWIQADALVRRNELNKQVGDMLDRVLPEDERELLRLYFGIGRRRHSIEELIALFDSERKVNALLQSAMERLRYSDEILTIYKYLHR